MGRGKQAAAGGGMAHFQPQSAARPAKTKVCEFPVSIFADLGYNKKEKTKQKQSKENKEVRI